jgi:glycosyltransferase involved in cell wall biosynthesis
LSEPVVAVVVPAYNAELYLEATLASIVGQSYTRWRALVVDDGSTDRTADVARELAGRDPRISLERQDNAGGSAARNKGMSVLAGTGARYLAYVDSDDLLLPDAFASLVSALEARPDAVGAYGLAEYIDGQGHPISPGAHSALQRQRKTFRPGPRAVAGGGLVAGAKAALAPFAGRDLAPDEDTGFDTLAIYGSIWPPAVALTRFDAVRQASGFDPSISFMEDWDLFLRLARRGPWVFLNQQVAWYRRHPRNTGSTGPSEASPLGGWGTGFLGAVATVRYRAWEYPANTAAQRLALARAHRRDGLSLAKRETEDLLRDLGRPSGWRQARGHLAWAAYGLWLAAHPHPVPPNRGWLRALERARSPRRGQSLP